MGTKPQGQQSLDIAHSNEVESTTNMVARSSQSEQDSLNALLQGALLLDLEVSHQGKILKLGAVLGDSTLARAGSGSGEGTFSELNNLAQRADCLLGHNLVRHD